MPRTAIIFHALIVALGQTPPWIGPRSSWDKLLWLIKMYARAPGLLLPWLVVVLVIWLILRRLDTKGAISCVLTGQSHWRGRLNP